ncbi:MAG: alpha/beta hydrolase, partial [Pseudomonadales bacterium]
SKLILVGSGPFEEKYVAELEQNRLGRLTNEERDEFKFIVDALADPETENKDALLARLGELAAKTDEYDAIEDEHDLEEGQDEMLASSGAIFQNVWYEAAALRRSGELLALARQVHCPVVALHGDYDPHPSEGVRQPLSSALKDFRFILLDRCGHTPWRERRARDQFYAILAEEIR